MARKGKVAKSNYLSFPFLIESKQGPNSIFEYFLSVFEAAKRHFVSRRKLKPKCILIHNESGDLKFKISIQKENETIQQIYKNGSFGVSTLSRGLPNWMARHESSDYVANGIQCIISTVGITR